MQWRVPLCGFQVILLQSKNIHIRINKHSTLALGVGECASDVCGCVHACVCPVMSW